MPGKAEYWYILKLDGEQALEEGKAFANAIKKELQEIRATANLVLKANVDTSAARKTAKTEAEKIAAEYKKALKAAQNDFTKTTSRFGAQQFTQNYRSMWEEGTVKPSAAAISSIRETEQAIGDLGKTAKRMGVTTDDLVDMGGLDRAITAVQSVQRRIWGLRGFGYQLESYGRSMTMTAAAMGAAVGLASKKYLDFADPLNRAARNLDLNAQLTAVLDRRLTELAGTVSMMNPQEQAEGLYLWAAATGAVVESEAELNQALQQADQVQRLARLGNISYGAAVEATTDVLSQYQLNISETERVVSTLIKVAAVSKAEVGDLAQAFSFAGARADLANTSFEETAAVFQLLSSFGLRGSRAGRGVAMLMENLIAPSEKARKEMDTLFKKVFGRTDVLENAEGQFVGMAEAVNTLAEATAHYTDIQTQEFVAKLTSQNASRALVPLLKLEAQARQQGISAIEATANILEGTVGQQERAFVKMMEAQTGYEMSTESATSTAQRYWQQLAESVSGQAEFIKARFDAAITDVGREMTTALLPVMEEAADLASKLAAYVSEHPEAAKIAIGAVAVTGILGLLTTAVGRGIRLVADVKTLAMATTLYNTATKQIEAAVLQMAASENQIRAAGMQGARQTIPGAGAQFLPGAGAAAGAGGMGALATAGLAAAAVVGVAALIKHIHDLNEERLDEAASITQVSDSYAGYLQAMEEAGIAKYALTEATYDLVKAQQAEQDQIDEAALKEYERALRDAATGGLLEAANAFDTFTGDWGATLASMPIDDFKDIVGATVTYLSHEFDGLQFTWAAQGDLAKQLADRYHLTGERAEYLAAALHEMARTGMLLNDPMRAGADAAHMAARGFGVLEEEEAAVTEETKKMVGATREIGPTWEEQIATLNRADDALLDTRNSLADLLATLALVPGAAGAFTGLENALANVEGNMKALRFEAIGKAIEEGANLGIASLEDLAEGAKSAADSGFDIFAGLTSYMTDAQIMANYKDYLAEMETTYQEASLMSERAGELHIQRWEDTWQEWADGHKEAQDKITKDAEQAQKDREKFLEDAQKGFEGLIEAALKPTSVTGLDMLQTDIGEYADKWDEAARRMRAAMEDPGGEWGFMIPEHIRAEGLDSAKAWGANWIDEFYAGMHPDAIDWPAFVTAFKNNLQREIAQGQLVDRAIQELAKEGITATSSEVLAALGMQSPLQQMFLGGLTPEQASQGLSGTMGNVVTGMSFPEGAFDPAASAVSGAFTDSLSTKLSETNLSTTLNALWVKQLGDTPDPIISVGRMAGALFWQGFEGSVDGASLIDTIVGIVMADLLEAIGAT